jgi:hypothetical protein
LTDILSWLSLNFFFNIWDFSQLRLSFSQCMSESQTEKNLSFWVEKNLRFERRFWLRTLVKAGPVLLFKSDCQLFSRQRWREGFMALGRWSVVSLSVVLPFTTLITLSFNLDKTIHHFFGEISKTLYWLNSEQFRPWWQAIMWEISLFYKLLLLLLILYIC